MRFKPMALPCLDAADAAPPRSRTGSRIGLAWLLMASASTLIACGSAGDGGGAPAQSGTGTGTRRPSTR